MKVAFCTCVQIGLDCINTIYSIGGKFDLLITLNDNKSVRKSGRVFLDEIADVSKTPLLKIDHIDEELVKRALIEFNIDWLFLVGWSQIASSETIRVPKAGVIGAHPTLLPVGRGRASVPWAILMGLDKTGVTFFQMDEGVDTGPILAQIEIPVSKEETATVLYDKVTRAHGELIQQLWPKLLTGQVHGQVQDETTATIWRGRTPADGELKLSMTVIEADRLIRATTHPYPGAFIFIDGKKHIVWSGVIGQHTGLQLEFRDGFFTAVDFTSES
jgi:methionyl-tRNA formyltransferase